MRLKTDCRTIDELLNGGIEAGVITEFYGEGGAGKTNICLQLARNCARANKKVIYIDTEGVSLERLRQMCGADFEQLVRRILFFEPCSLEEQDGVVNEAMKITQSDYNIGLIVVDSATVHYRYKLGNGNEVNSLRLLSQQITRLLEVARKRNVPVVITNQVYTDIETNELEPLGGQILKHIAKTIIKLERLRKNRRVARLMKHRSIGEDLSAEFVLTENGVECKKGIL